MTYDRRTVVKLIGAGVLIVVSATVIVSRVNRARQAGEVGLSVWFYDESEKRLYAAPRDAVPPDAGIGGEKGDGVRAVVVAGPGEEGDPSKRRIAYLETYTPELKARADGIREGRAAESPGGAAASGGEEDSVRKNTLVRRVEETTWHDLTSAEAAAIMTEWRGWTSADGKPLVVCVP